MFLYKIEKENGIECGIINCELEDNPFDLLMREYNFEIKTIKLYNINIKKGNKRRIKEYTFKDLLEIIDYKEV